MEKNESSGKNILRYELIKIKNMKKEKEEKALFILSHGTNHGYPLKMWL